MAYSIQQLNAQSAPDGDYPSGRIIDESVPGAEDGTQISAAQHDQFWQFFDQLMTAANLTFNGSPDNVTNGFQLMQALQRYTRAGAERHTLIGTVPFEQIATTYHALQLEYGTTEFDLGSSSANDVVSFGDHPIMGQPYYLYFTATSGTFPITINSTNAGSMPVIRKSGVVGADTAYTIPTETMIMVIRRTDEWELFEL